MLPDARLTAKGHAMPTTTITLRAAAVADLDAKCRRALDRLEDEGHRLDCVRFSARMRGGAREYAATVTYWCEPSAREEE